MSWTVRPWLRRTLTAWREVSAAAAARLALSASSARSPRRSLTTLLCPLLCEEKERSKEQRSVVSEKRARRGALPAMPPPQPQHSVAPDRRPRECPHTPGVRGANLEDASDVIKAEPLPPCTRGERARDHHDGPGGASTPACAGQTTGSSSAPSSSGLYPRVRGANRSHPVLGAVVQPLPPRARGKRGADDVRSMG